MLEIYINDEINARGRVSENIDVQRYDTERKRERESIRAQGSARKVKGVCPSGREKCLH